MISIRRRLLQRLLSAALLLWVVLAALVYSRAHHEVEEVLDAELAQYARVLQALAASRLAAEAEELRVGGYSEARPAEGHSYERKLRFQVWGAEGRMLLHSEGTAVDAPPPSRAGYGTEAGRDHQWRTFTLLSGPHDIRVRVAERDDVRGEMIIEIVLDQLAPGLLALPIGALVIWISVGRGLRPLRRVAEEVARRAPDQLEPLSLLQIPSEISPLVAALNRLFGRLQIAFERERRFIADAAHELRTPLAAIKAQAQAALVVDEPAERRQALENIVRGVDRATHLEAQLLTLARLEPEARGALRRADVPLARLAREVLAELGPMAIQHAVELGLDADEAVQARASADLLAILLRNLVENAVRHTPVGGSVDVVVSGTAESATISVCDSGPGIPAAERERVFERFYRGRGEGSAGSGLGLSIVKRIVDLHGGSVQLEDSPTGGLQVAVTLRRADGSR